MLNCNGKPITGMSLAHSRGTKQQQTLIGGWLVTGSYVLTGPTVPQAARLVGVSPSLINLALVILPNDVLVGQVEEKQLALAAAAQRQQVLALPKLAEPTTAISSDERIDSFIATAGVTRTLDRLSLALI
jgi:hypothetical protein